MILLKPSSVINFVFRGNSFLGGAGRGIKKEKRVVVFPNIYSLLRKRLNKIIWKENILIEKLLEKKNAELAKKYFLGF